MKARPRKLPITESMVKSQVKDLLDASGIFHYHVLQGLGCYPGLPDRVMHLGGHVVYLEIKKPTGALSENQTKFQDQCSSDDVEYWVIRDVEDLQKKLRFRVHAEREGHDG